MLGRKLRFEGLLGDPLAGAAVELPGVREIAVGPALPPTEQAEAELARLVSDTEQQLPELAEQPETEARLRMALARLDRALGNLDAADAHLARALELSRDTRGLSWNDTDRCLEQLCELRAQRGDARSLDLARERVELLGRRDEPARRAQARRVLDDLQARFERR